MATGIERFWKEAAYVAALTEYLIEHKDDETDHEIAEILKHQSYMLHIVIDVLTIYKP